MDKPIAASLAVILHADVAGSTALVQRDESVAHQRITDALRRFSSTIGQYGGTAHEVRGDALVAEFSRASDAVCAVLAFQAANTVHNTRISDAIAPVIRAGISLGEVIVADNTVTGAGVVLAQRVEQLAEPGGMCITGAIHEAMPRRLPLDYENLGEQQLKGFEDPIRVYAARLARGEEIPPPQAITAHRAWKPMASVAAMGIVAIAGALAWLGPWKPHEQPSPQKPMATRLPDKPSIAVLPFTNMSGDPDQAYFGDGIAEDIITDLSKISGLFVIARNSSFNYKGKNVAIKTIARDLEVQYVLEGSVRRAGDALRINAQLIEARSDRHLWAQRYDGGLADIFRLQDRITQEIIAAVEVELTGAERLEQRAAVRAPDAQAYDLVLRGVDLLRRFKYADATKAKSLFEQAVQRDPAYARPYALLGLYHVEQWALWGKGRDKNLREALVLADKASRLDESDPTPHVIAAQAYQFLREFAKAGAQADKALALRPNDAVTRANLGRILLWAHRPAEAIPLLDSAIRLDPFHPSTYLDWLSFAYAIGGRYAECVRTAERGVRLDPDFVSLHVNLAICYALLGRTVEAKRAAKEVLRANPRFTVSAYAGYVPFSEQADIDRTADALRQAGLPD